MMGIARPNADGDRGGFAADRSASRSSAARSAPWRFLLATAGVVLLAFVLANAAAPFTGFNPDESRWISRAHYLAALADPFGPVWADRYMTRGQPPLGSYAMGLGLLAHGRDLHTNPPWDFAITWETNIAVGNKPVPEDLAAGRRTSAVLVALTTAVVVAAARAFIPAPWALLAGALFAVHPFTIYIGSIAMADALFGLLIALAAAAAAALARRPTWTRAAVLGALLGLGGATKLSPLVLAVGLTGAGVVLFVIAAIRQRQLPGPEGRLAAHGLAIGIAACIVFVAVYPYLWPDPAGRTANLFAFRTEEMAAQASDWPVMAVPTRAEALRRVGINFGERFSLSGALATLLGTGVPAGLRQIEVTVPLVGVALMTVLAIRDGPFSPRALVLAVLGGQSLITILGMRSEFDRYHLPMALLGAVGAAVALYGVSRVADRVIPWPAILERVGICGGPLRPRQSLSAGAGASTRRQG
jgi:hypothetical protein